MKERGLFSLQGKVAWVTGGSRGLGLAMARGLAEAGASIAFNARSRESMERGMEAYETAGIEAHGYVCDVTDEARRRVPASPVRFLVAAVQPVEIGIVSVVAHLRRIVERESFQ